MDFRPRYGAHEEAQSPRRVHLRAPVFQRGGAFLRCGQGALRFASCKEVPADVRTSPNAGWVHLTTYGTWKGHPDVEEFSFNDEVFAEIRANFVRQRTPVPFKYEHPNYRPDGSPIPSSGKVYDLRLNDKGLWGYTLFTDRAAEMVRAREYEFCSVVVLFSATDRKSGKQAGAVLFEVGLTDHPFVDGQEAIRLPDPARAA